MKRIVLNVVAALAFIAGAINDWGAVSGAFKALPGLLARHLPLLIATAVAIAVARWDWVWWRVTVRSRRTQAFQELLAALMAEAGPHGLSNRVGTAYERARASVFGSDHAAP